MKKYDFNIIETLARVVTIEAETLEEAEEKIRDMYNNEEIVLDSSDFQDTNIEILRDSEGNEYV